MQVKTKYVLNEISLRNMKQTDQLVDPLSKFGGNPYLNSALKGTLNLPLYMQTSTYNSSENSNMNIYACSGCIYSFRFIYLLLVLAVLSWDYTDLTFNLWIRYE